MVIRVRALHKSQVMKSCSCGFNLSSSTIAIAGKAVCLLSQKCLSLTAIRRDWRLVCHITPTCWPGTCPQGRVVQIPFLPFPRLDLAVVWPVGPQLLTAYSLALAFCHLVCIENFRWMNLWELSGLDSGCDKFGFGEQLNTKQLQEDSRQMLENLGTAQSGFVYHLWPKRVYWWSALSWDSYTD